MLKFNSDRHVNYQVKTFVFEEKGVKKVRKEAITAESQAHLKQICRNYEVLKMAYPDCKVCPVAVCDNGIEFEYIEGDMLSSRYRTAIRKRDKRQFLDLVNRHVDIIKGNKNNECTFRSSLEFEKYFGNGVQYEGKSGLNCVNFEATAQNIIFEGETPVFIDYEWVFQFPIPLDLVLYHTIIKVNSFYLVELDNVISQKELFDYLNIQCDMDQLEQSWQHFYQLLDGRGKENLTEAKLSQYRKEILDYRSLSDEVVRLRGVDEYNRNLLMEMQNQQINMEELSKGIVAQNTYIASLESGIKNQTDYIQALEKGTQEQHKYIENLEKDLKEQQRYIQYCETRNSESNMKLDKLEYENKITMEKLQSQKSLIEQQQKHLLEQACYINKVKGSLIGKMFF